MVCKSKNRALSTEHTGPACNTRGAQAARAQEARAQAIPGDRDPETADDFIPLPNYDEDEETHLEHDIPTPQTPEQAQRAACGVYPTPLVYLKGEMPRKRATRSRAVNDAIHHDFCEITHHPNTCSAVEGCHCVPRSWMGPLSEKRVSYFVPILAYAKLRFRCAVLSTIWASDMPSHSIWTQESISSFVRHRQALPAKTICLFAEVLVSYHRYFDGGGLIFLPLMAIALMVQTSARTNIKRGLGEKILYMEVSRSLCCIYRRHLP